MGTSIRNYSMKSAWLAALLVLVLCGPLAADGTKEVKDLLQSRLDDVLVVLQNNDLSFGDKKAEVSRIVTPMFDFPLMAKLTLGRKHWPTMNRQQQDRFTTLFVDLLKQTYLDRISQYTDERVVIQNAAVVNRKVHIQTDLVSKGESISMLYKFYRSSGGWKIYDLEVEGVSLVVSYRKQFDQILNTGTIDDLIQQLEQPEKT